MKNKNIHWQQIIIFLLYTVIGILCGSLVVLLVEPMPQMSVPEKIMWFVGLFVVMYLAILFHLVIHEAGHLLFGLISGYRFSSFRILNWMWIKEDNRLKFRSLSIAGTGGQCLMSPPDLVDGKIPIILYNLGGSLINTIFGILFLILFILTTSAPFICISMLICGMIGLMFAVMNGVPMRMGTVDNDGYNAYSLTRSPEAMRAFWIQMKVHEQIASGHRLKDMPDEWFTMPSNDELSNSMVAVIGVFSCNRLMDQQNFSEADSAMEHLLAQNTGMVGLHRNLMICDRIYMELIHKNRQTVLNDLLSTEQIKFMKTMKRFPSVLRTQYAYALLSEKDSEKAAEIATQFDKYVKLYPYPHEVEAEKELMDIAKAKCCSKK